MVFIPGALFWYRECQRRQSERASPVGSPV
jgi:hypothetical protein